MKAFTRTAIVESLRRDIVSNRFEPGEKLPILELQDRFGVGLTALHKAFAELAADGLVTSESERGIRAATVSRADLLDLSTARPGIEALAIRDAIAHSDADSDAQIVAAYYKLTHTAMYEASSEKKILSEVYLRSHREFHDALAAACQSAWLRRFRSVLFVHAERYQQLFIAYRERNSSDEHAAIMQAVLDRDADLAVALLASHYNDAARLLLEEHFAE
jgi:GntR family transcriptional regulator, carbon starvation induced regulator